MPRTANEVLDQEFLIIRAKILEVAAFYDRLVESSAPVTDTQKLDLLQAGCQILNDDSADKAARLQLLFSREYSANWREEFSI